MLSSIDGALTTTYIHFTGKCFRSDLYCIRYRLFKFVLLITMSCPDSAYSLSFALNIPVTRFSCSCVPANFSSAPQRPSSTRISSLQAMHLQSGRLFLIQVSLPAPGSPIITYTFILSTSLYFSHKYLHLRSKVQ